MSQLHRNLSGAEIKVSSVSTSEKYKPQHPMLGLPNAIPTSSQDHLDDFTEVNPFKREEMEDAEGFKALIKGKLAARAKKKKAKAKAKVARKTAEAVNKLAVGVGKLKEKAKQLIKKAVEKYGIDEESLKEKMSDHLNTFGKELLDM